MQAIKVLTRLIRVRQWVKNVFVFAPILFAEQLFHLELVMQSLLAFIAFSLAASAMYILNDIRDLKNDKAHPVKKKRPLPAGEIGVGQAGAIGISFALISFLLALRVNTVLLSVIGVYVLMISVYSLWLKNRVIIDVIIIAIGFVMRVIAGAVAIKVIVSPWLLMTTFFLALFLGLGKRRHEILLLKKGATKHRANLGEYTEILLDKLIVVTVAASLLSYALYTLSPETISRFNSANLIYTIPFVTYGLFHYLYLIYRKNGGGDPTSTLYTDIPFIINAFVWLGLVIGIIYSAI